MKMWSGRIDSAVNSDFERWQRSFDFDQRLLKFEVDASKAHARALAEIGVLTAEELKTIVKGLDAIPQHAVESPQLLNDPEVEDVHHFVEKTLASLVGEVAFKLHSGRSRNEQIATDLRLFVRAGIEESLQQITHLLNAIVEQAETADEAVMPAYTHLRRAEPVLTAHWLLAYFEMFARDAERLQNCRDRLNFCPLGSGAIAGATLPLRRSRVAEELQFDAPTANSMDATSDRDFAIEFVQIAALTSVHLSRLAEELILFSSEEFGFVSLSQAYCTGSSAMPQKSNPYALELIRGKSARLIAANVNLLTIVKGLPLAYNKDLQETQEPILDAVETLTGLLRVTVGVVAGLRLNTDKMAAATATGHMNAMAAATYLVNKGIPFRRAHEQIGRAVTYCISKGKELQDCSLDELRQFGEAFGDDFYDSISRTAVLDCHDVYGGTARHRVRQALAKAKQRVAAMPGGVHAYA